MRQVDALNYLIRKGPGRTEAELARAIYGDKAYQQRVNQDCFMLVIEGKAEQRGAGRRGDPYRYGRSFPEREPALVPFISPCECPKSRANSIARTIRYGDEILTNALNESNILGCKLRECGRTR